MALLNRDRCIAYFSRAIAMVLSALGLGVDEFRDNDNSRFHEKNIFSQKTK
jgi:hypothetical protein